MTRINCIPPEDLLDQHLLAEYNETAMVMASLRRSKISCAKSGKPLPKRDKYTLNAGHVIFFYSRGKFLYRRYHQLKDELIGRGFNLDPERDKKLEWGEYSDDLWNDWTPTLEDQKINLERILDRFEAKPDWYKFKRKPVDKACLRDHYKNWSFKPC